MKRAYCFLAATAILMLAVLGLLAWWYIAKGTFHFWITSPGESLKSSEWANFGTFMGGVGGPVLTALSAILVAAGLTMQAHASLQAFRQSTMTASHESLGWARGKLDKILEQELPSPRTPISLHRLILAHAQGRSVSLSDEQAKCLDALLPDVVYWLHACVEQVRLFQANHKDLRWTLQQESRFYGDILKFAKFHEKRLPAPVAMSLGFIATHYSR